MTPLTSITGLTPEAAKALLVGLGFGYEDGGQVDSEVPAGKVVLGMMGRLRPSPSNTLEAYDLTTLQAKGRSRNFSRNG